MKNIPVLYGKEIPAKTRYPFKPWQRQCGKGARLVDKSEMVRPFQRAVCPKKSRVLKCRQALIQPITLSASTSCKVSVLCTCKSANPAAPPDDRKFQHGATRVSTFSEWTSRHCRHSATRERNAYTNFRNNMDLHCIYGSILHLKLTFQILKRGKQDTKHTILGKKKDHRKNILQPAPCLAPLQTSPLIPQQSPCNVLLLSVHRFGSKS